MDLGKGCNTVCVTNGGLVTALAASALALGALVGCSPDTADPAPTVTSFRVEADHTAGSTCAAWTSMKKALPGVSQLPEGWTYEDQYIDVQIHSRAAQLTKLLDIFKAKLDGASPGVAAAADRFVEAQAAEATKLTEHTFDAADQAAIADARHALDRACDIPN